MVNDGDEWHERLLQSQDQEGRLYKDQLERVHRSLAQSTRATGVGGGALFSRNRLAWDGRGAYFSRKMLDWDAWGA